MNARTIRRAARALLVAGALSVAGAAAPAHALGGLCLPQPTPVIGLGASKGYFYEHDYTILKVRLSNPSCSNVSVDFWTSDGTAQNGTDYTGISKLRLTFTPGQVEKTFFVFGVNDREVEGAETFFVNVANASGGTILLSPIMLIVDGTEPG